MKWPSWLPRVLVESALIVFSVLMALAVDQWRDSRATEARARDAVAAITAELQANRAAAERARSFHLETTALLKAVADRKQLPEDDIAYQRGMFNPATVVQAAWVTAREAATLQTLPLDAVLRLSRVYELQESYAQLGDEIARDVYIDLRRRGFEAVLREGFAGFILLTTDFATREAKLIERYDEALKMLAALPQ